MVSEQKHDPKGSNSCYHCGEDCGVIPVEFDEKIFCCSGCRMVFEILSKNDACDYYRYEEHPGLKSAPAEIGNRFAYLDNIEIAAELLDFYEDGISRIKLYVPSIHCSSCIWLLENLHRFNHGIRHSTVNFVKKEVAITFNEKEVSLRQVVELLASVNYLPQITPDSLNKKVKRKGEYGIYYRLGVAGFCFGNVMLFSFPAYLSINDTIENLLRQNFGILNILFGSLVTIFSGSIFFVSAYRGLKKRFISIDVPIALGIIVLYLRSVYEISTGTGPGFMDSLAGLIFFLLIGRWYQSKTYQALSFERDYLSYFPVAVTVISDQGTESIVPLKSVKPGMRLLVRNQELIPADSLLVKGNGSIDYSFVSGESAPIAKQEGDRIYAGGRQVGASIEVLVEKEVAQSRLTELWNQDMAGTSSISGLSSLIDRISKYFTVTILLISLGAGAFWWFIDPSEAVMVMTAILIVACPCALAMTLPFSLGGAMRLFGRNNFYVKKTLVIESMAKVDTIVFDKTGTITRNDELHAGYSDFTGRREELTLVASLVRHSTHPASIAIYRSLPGTAMLPVTDFREVPSAGISGFVDGHFIQAGSAEFVTGNRAEGAVSSRVYLSIDGKQLGFVRIHHRYREKMAEVLRQLAKHYDIHLLSGDNDAERENLRDFFPSDSHLNFNKSPREKLEYIRELKQSGKKVLMMGDGLNDAGALQESHCGISVADDIYHFSPACDGILESAQFERFPEFLKFTRKAMHIVIMSITLSFLYNLVGLAFAITGNLTPIVSAIMMPLSSVSVIAFITLSVWISAQTSKFPVK